MEEPAYTIFVRVPIPRGDFVDPPPVSSPSPPRRDGARPFVAAGLITGLRLRRSTGTPGRMRIYGTSSLGRARRRLTVRRAVLSYLLTSKMLMVLGTNL